MVICIWRTPPEEHDTRLSPARVEQALSQFEAQVLPEDHPSMSKIKGLWGDHTYFLAPNGLNIVEPIDADGVRRQGCRGGQSRDLDRRQRDQPVAACAADHRGAGRIRRRR